MKPGESVVSPMRVVITPDYFDTMRTPLVRGRFFNDRDNETSPGVVIVDEKLAQKFWPGADPIGRRIKWIYFISDRTGVFQIWKIPPSGGDAVQVTSNGGFMPIGSPDGAYV